MKHYVDKNLTCQGFPKGTIVINYNLKSGYKNGISYQGTTRVAYLPDNN
jgi:hypothetical protein